MPGNHKLVTPLTYSTSLQILKLNLKSTSDSKILKFWIWEDFIMYF
jgi:hypothetical protein